MELQTTAEMPLAKPIHESLVKAPSNPASEQSTWGGVLGLVSPHMWAAKGRQANALSTIPSSQVFPILGAANHYFIIQPGNILVLLPPAIYTCWETQTNDRACFRISLGLQETCVTLEMPQYIFTSAWY